MTKPISVPSLDKTARLAGLMFLLSLVVPTLGWTLALARTIVPGDAVATGRAVAAHPLLFRAGILSEVLTAVVVLVLAAALYRLLESVDKNVATIALLLKIGEGALWAVIAVAHVAALRALDEGTSGTLAAGQLHALVGLLLAAHMPITAVPGMLLGLNLVVFLSLLLRSGFVPRGLAAFGVLSYALVFLYDLLLIASPSLAANVAVQVIGWGPSVVFELAVGPWLLIKGISQASAEPSSVVA
jgi:hypothetical protein